LSLPRRKQGQGSGHKQILPSQASVALFPK
jgi:hypothetical protein